MCKSLILLGGDIETNPDPVSSSEQYFSVCHWNLNSIAAHKYSKFSLFTAYNLLHSFDIICLWETYPKSETPSNDTRLELPSYNLFRSDYPSNDKREGVCIYCKSTLGLRILNISSVDECINFEVGIECINFEVDIANRMFRLIQLYRSPSQKQDEF